MGDGGVMGLEGGGGVEVNREQVSLKGGWMMEIF